MAFDYPCTSPFSFAVTSQTDPDDDNYSETTVTFTLTPFTITPDACISTETYECTAVSGPADVNGNTDYKSRLCPQGSFDGVLDGTPDEGTLDLIAYKSEFLDDTLPVGDYTFTITATTEGGAQL